MVKLSGSLAETVPEKQYYCIAGLTRVSSGTVRILGKTIYAGTILGSMVGLIIENPGFLPNYSGYQNLSMLYSISKKVDKDTIKVLFVLLALILMIKNM